MKKLAKKILAVLIVVALLSLLPISSIAATLVWPVPGHTNLSQGFHDGAAIDISDGSIAGATVVAAMSGSVTNKFTCGQQHYGSMGDCSGFGTGIVILGDDNRYYQYAHMQANSIPSGVYVGARVSAGQMIGRVGTTGNSSGNHLHFGISTGTWYNHSGINPQNETYTYVSTSVDIGNDFYAYIVKYSTWKYLEASSEVTQIQQTSAHCNVQLAKYGNDNTDPRQIWHFIRQSNGSYKIQNAYDDGCMDVYDAKTDSYTNVITTKDDHGRDNQRWIINDNPSWNSSRLIPQHALNTSLDVSGDSNSPGANIAIHDSNDSSAQGFSISKIAYSKPAKPSASTVSVKTLGQPNQTTTLSWTASALKDNKFDNRSYTLTLTKDGADYQTKTGLTSTSFNLALPKGTYTAKVRAINTKYYNYYTDGNTLTFTVKDCSHTWNNGTVTTAPSCTSTGVRTYTCTSCGATRTETISKTDHTITLINKKDATYDAEGYTGDEYCSVCKQIINKGSVIPKLTGTEQEPSNEQNQQEKTGGCPWCGQTHKGVIIAFLVAMFHVMLAAIFGARY